VRGRTTLRGVETSFGGEPVVTSVGFLMVSGQIGRLPPPFRAGLLAVLALPWLGVGGCDSVVDNGDPFPIYVDVRSGPVMAQLSLADGETPVAATIDTLSPFTIVDSLVPGQALPPVERRDRNLTLFGARTPASTEQVPRARFAAVSVFELHPCYDVFVSPQIPCAVGPDGATTPIGAIIGADTLARGAARFDFAKGSLQLFPDIAGQANEHAAVCEAVFDSPFYGGGTLFAGGSEIPFNGRRPAIGACLAPTPEGATWDQRGVAVLLLLSTGVGPTILSESGYERYRQFVGDAAPEVSALPATTVHLPSGPVAGRTGHISRMALVSERTNNRGPCGELLLNRLLSPIGATCADLPREPMAPQTVECPCESSLCTTAAVVDLEPPGDGLEVVVIPDSAPILQALRAELRPQLPEVDGILGTTALASLQIDVDYANDRVIARCVGSGCLVRPSVFDVESQRATAHCLEQADGGVDGGVDGGPDGGADGGIDGGVADAAPVDAAL
jgi:hypothetical protein